MAADNTIGKGKIGYLLSTEHKEEFHPSLNCI